jgi:uncharacterized membrane protein SpoIIM required for sporulation
MIRINKFAIGSFIAFVVLTLIFYWMYYATKKEKKNSALSIFVPK